MTSLVHASRRRPEPPLGILNPNPSPNLPPANLLGRDPGSAHHIRKRNVSNNVKFGRVL